MLVKRIHHIFGIRVEFHLAGPVQCFQTYNGSHQLHPVIGGFFISLREFPDMFLSLSIHTG